MTMDDASPLREIIRPGTHVDCEHGFVLLSWHDLDEAALVAADDGWGVIQLTEDDIKDRLATSEEVVMKRYDLDGEWWERIADPETPNTPAATLEIPTEKDVTYIRELIQRGYSEIEPQYEAAAADPQDGNEGIVRAGSLYQELLAQLNNQDN